MTSEKKPSANKGSILKRWLNRKKSQPKKEAISNETLPARTSAPLSFGQQRLWFLEQLYPNNPFYHYADAYRLKGRLNVANLLESFQKVAQRHDILRTTFEAQQGQAIQKVGKETAFDIAQFDLRSLPEATRKTKAQEIALTEGRRPFELKTGPLTRISLVQLAEEDHLLVLTMHHIITDKWSMQVLREDLATAYRQMQTGQSTPSQPLSIQYADFADTQRKQKVDAKHLAYWKEKLAGDLAVLKLPTDHPHPVRPSFKGTFCKQTLSKKLSIQLRALSIQSKSTLFILLLTAYKVLLHRYSDQTDILIGTPFTNRDRMELQNLIGFFNETLVLRSDLSGDPTFLELVEQVRQTSLEAFSHKNVPFETLVRTLSPERYGSSNPLFQTMFLFHEVPAKPTFSPDLSLEHAPFDLGIAKFDLTLYIQEEEEQLTSIFEYMTDLFEKTTIERMQGHLKTLLESIVDNPNQPISKLALLPSEERHQMLVEWNATATLPYPSNSIHELIEKHAAQSPEKTAVAFEGDTLSYKVLNARANTVAQQLRALGVGTNIIVGLFAKRSLDLAVGILGILKAGSAYLPLDSEYPAERIQFMVEDAEVPVILTQADLIDLLPKTKAKILTIASISDDSASTFDSQKLSDKESMAYIIYTSGSTGKPKGVPVTHGNLIHSTTSRFDFYAHQPASFLLLSSFAFDSSIVGIFWTLCSGGTLVLPPRRIEQDVEELGILLSKHQVTHTLLLPSLYAVLLQHLPTEKLTSLNTVMVAGEACGTSLCQQHFEKLPNTRLYNEYGPTEASVWCTAHEIKPADIGKPIPIGRPIPNATNYILDKHLQPNPVGVAGELYIGGVGVTKGYWKRPDLTKERFIPHPFNNDSATRLYKTGDLARYRSDGIIEFLGRADHQVKIRGHRIELEEIKEVLQQFPGIQEAIVVVHTEDEKALKTEVEQLTEILETLDPIEANQLLKIVAGELTSSTNSK